MTDELFLRSKFVGERFEGGRLSVDAAPELAEYRSLVVALAKHLLKVRTGRQRVPKGFESGFELWIGAVVDGSACVDVHRRLQPSEDPQVALDLEGDDFERSQQMIATLIADPSTLPEGFPRVLLSRFNGFGKSLLPGESLVLELPTGESATYTPKTRRALVLQQQSTYEDVVEVRGSIAAVDVERSKFTILLDDGRTIPAPLSEEIVDMIRRLVGRRDSLVSVSGSGSRDSADRVMGIDTVEDIGLLQDEDEVALLDVPKRLEVLSTLDEGWLDGEGSKVTAAAMTAAAHELLQAETDGCPRPHLFPTLVGGLQAEWSLPEWEVTVEFFPDGLGAELMGVHVETGAAKDKVVQLASADGALSKFVRSFMPQPSSAHSAR